MVKLKDYYMLLLKEKVIVKPVAEFDTEIENDSNSELDKKMIQDAFQNSTNNLIQSYWNAINDINSLTSMIQHDFGSEKDDVVKLLESCVNDTTMIIGMLYKVFFSFNAQTEQLIDAGEEKAEEIMQTQEVEDESSTSETASIEISASADEN